MLKVGLVGCGKVARYHLDFINRMKNARIECLADADKKRRDELAKKYGITNVYSSLEEMLDRHSLDVLHITTPPKYHYEQSRIALERGVNIFIEKPMAYKPEEVYDLYKKADEKGLYICPDFIQLFHPCMQKAIKYLSTKKLGKVVYCDAHIGVDTDIPDINESKDLPWCFDMPGGVLHNYITHPLYLVLYLIGGPVDISISSRTFGTLPQGLTDHIDIMLKGDLANGHISVSCATRPYRYYLNILCENGSILVDFRAKTALIESDTFFYRTTPGFLTSYQLLKSAVTNIFKYVFGRLYPYQGLDNLIRKYYETIENKTPAPVSADLAIQVSKTESAITGGIEKAHLDNSARPSRQNNIKMKEKVLVTGSSGYIGSEIVRRLIEEGYFVRSYVRPKSDISELERLGVEIIFGDIRDYNKFYEATGGVDVIVHAAAALKGSKDFVSDSCITGTANVAKAAKERGIRKVIYISSASIYDFTSLKKGSVVTENSPLEKYPELRGNASSAKRKAEEIALSEIGEKNTGWTIIRPSVVFGDGRNILSLLGSRVGNIEIVFGSPRTISRFIHIDDLVDAVFKIMQSDKAGGRIYNISYPEPLRYGEIVGRVAKNKRPNIVYIPYIFGYLGYITTSALNKINKRFPAISYRQLNYIFSSVSINSNAIREQLEWNPKRIPAEE